VGVEPLGTILSVVQQLLHGYVLMVPDPETTRDTCFAVVPREGVRLADGDAVGG
jgi:hypothetical protein